MPKSDSNTVEEPTGKVPRALLGLGVFLSEAPQTYADPQSIRGARKRGAEFAKQPTELTERLWKSACEQAVLDIKARLVLHQDLLMFGSPRHPLAEPEWIPRGYGRIHLRWPNPEISELHGKRTMYFGVSVVPFADYVAAVAKAVPDAANTRRTAASHASVQKQKTEKVQLRDEETHSLIKATLQAALPKTMNRLEVWKAVQKERPEARQEDVYRCFQDQCYDSLVRRRKGPE